MSERPAPTSVPAETLPFTQPSIPRGCVLTVAYPYAPIGPRAVGGAEVICTEVEAAIVRLGFASAVVAHAQSQPCGRLYGTVVPSGTITDAVRAQVERNQQAAIDRACAENQVILVHMHGLDFHRYRVPEQLPVLVTLHLPPAWYPETIWTLPPRYTLVCVSESQRRACPVEAQGRLRVVENGVALPAAATLRPEGRYALLMARICPEKNIHTGLDAARQAGLPAMLGGEVFPYEAHLRYFEQEIRPRLTAVANVHQQRGSVPPFFEAEPSQPEAATQPSAPTARFLGPLSGAEKSRMLARAACLLLPSLAPETSSLVAMEALAAGIPVIGMRVGAVPEIVEDGRTGYLIEPGPQATAALAEALRRLPTLNRQACRQAAEERFPLDRMLQGYATLYRELAAPVLARQGASQTPVPAAPAPAERTPDEIATEELLTDAALHQLAPEWTALWATDPAATPFQHPAWLLPWWRQFGPDGKLASLALRARGSRQLLGLAPFYTYADPGSGARKLLLAGAGTTDYLDGVWHPGAGELAARCALQHLLDRRHSWDDLALTQLRAASVLTTAGEALGLQRRPAEPCARVSLHGALPSKIRLNLNRYHHRAEALGTLRCTLAGTPPEASAAFDALVHLHSQRWQQRGEEGVLADPRVLAHHREALPLLLAAGLLCLFHLTLDGHTLGVLYGLQSPAHARDRRLFLYLIGFDQTHAALSPGTLLLGEAAAYARARGIAALDLLRGGEGYKQFWGAIPEDTYALAYQP